MTPMGALEPRIENVPPWVNGTAAQEAIELAALAGLHLDPWQCRILEGAFGRRADGQWSAREVGVVAGRQNGKSLDVKAAMLAGAFLLGEEIVFTSHLMSTTRKMCNQVLRLIESTPDLDCEVHRILNGNEERSIELRSGARIDFSARTESTARGWSGDRVFFDEAYALHVEQVGALMPIILTRPHWQLWYVSMAGKARSHALRRIRSRGMAGDPGLAYYEWSADDEIYWADPEAGAVDVALQCQANPSVGIRIDLESIALLQRSMDPAEFAREILCIWDDPRGQALIDLLAWAALADPGSSIEGGMVFAIEASPGLTSGAIGVAGYRADGIPHLEITSEGELGDAVLDHRAGVGWIVDRAVALNDRWSPFAWVLDPSGPAGALLTDLRAADIEPELLIGREVTQACGNLIKEVLSPEGDRVRHLGQQALTDAISVVRKRDSGDGGWAFGRQASGDDISPLNAVTFALHGLAVYGARHYDVLASVH